MSKTAEEIRAKFRVFRELYLTDEPAPRPKPEKKLKPQDDDEDFLADPKREGCCIDAFWLKRGSEWFVAVIGNGYIEPGETVQVTSKSGQVSSVTLGNEVGQMFRVGKKRKSADG